MAVWKSKSCPECGNDLIIQLEPDGWFEECLWCGYDRDISHLIDVSTGKHAKTNGQIASGQKLFTNVHVTLAN
jgi:hypothetical protein